MIDLSRLALRPIGPSDLALVRRLQAAVFFQGGPLPFPVADFDLLVAYLVDYFVTEEPGGGWLAVDDQGRQLGFCTGTAHPARHAAWQQRQGLRLARRWAANWRRYDAFTRFFYRLRLADAWEMIRDPGPPSPSSFHMNMAPAVRGYLWRPMMRCFARYAKSQGADRFCLEIGLPVRREQILCRLGFELVHRSPHHTLTRLTGQPHVRVKMVMDCDLPERWRTMVPLLPG